MGQTFVKCCRKEESCDSSSVYELPAAAIDNLKEKEGGKKKKRNKFLRWMKGRKVHPAPETAPEPAVRSGDDVISGRHLTGESVASKAVTDPGVPASPDRSVSHSGDVVQSPVHSAGQVDLEKDESPKSSRPESDCEQEMEQTPVNQPEEELEFEKENGSIEEVNSCQYEIGNELGQGGFGTVYEGTRLSDGVKVALKYVVEGKKTDYINRRSKGGIQEYKKYKWIEEINSCQYGIGKKLGQGGFGSVFEGTRLTDGLKVALKYLDKDKNTGYIRIPGYDKPIPREVALLILANEGDPVPEIIRLLDWQDCDNDCIMVLERFTPCEDVASFIKRYGGYIDEALARVILRQVTEAAQVCRRRGVFHRDIKLTNLLVDPDTVKVKLIDFGCGDLLKTSPYRKYMGTEKYTCPEFTETGKYMANPATVYSLGVLLFVMVCGAFPNRKDLYQMKKKKWCEDGLTTECCNLIQSCLQANPKERMLLKNILEHVWFQDKDGVC